MHSSPKSLAVVVAQRRKRFLRHVRVSKLGCWLWQGALTQAPDGGGYGKFWWSIEQPHSLAHRAAWQLYRGEIPEGMTIDHRCNVRRCVNPAHLQVLTMRENILRGNGWAARNARKTSCANGHPYTPETTGTQKGTGRFCRICRRQDYKRYHRRKAAGLAGK